MINLFCCCCFGEGDFMLEFAVKNEPKTYKWLCSSGKIAPNSILKLDSLNCQSYDILSLAACSISSSIWQTMPRIIDIGVVLSFSSAMLVNLFFKFLLRQAEWRSTTINPKEWSQNRFCRVGGNFWQLLGLVCCVCGAIDLFSSIVCCPISNRESLIVF